ncbi:MAG: putative collagen-binding domain-containing protein, partial [Planctomycetota bacterium]
LWGNIMAGGAGVEWYFGYKHPHSDLTCQDWRTREKVWTQCRYALDFFEKQNIPFWNMKCEDEMTENTEDYVLCKSGRIYLVYLKRGGKVEIKPASGRYSYGWFNPRTGEGVDGLLHAGSVSGARKVEVAAPDDNDWLLVIKGSGKLELASDQPPAPEVVPSPDGAIVLRAIRDFKIVTGDGFVPAYKDDGHDALAINPGEYKDKFAAAETKFTGDSGVYNITLTTMAETDGESTYKLLIDGKLVGQFTNPKTTVDYKPTPKTWKNVSVAKGATLRVEFNTATNSTATSGRIPYARGRWIALTLAPPAAGKAKPAAARQVPSEARVFEEAGGLVAVEAEHFAVQTDTETRKWYITTASETPDVSPDGDENHGSSASGGAYLEILPDTRRNHSMKLINGENFSNVPGKLGVLVYPVRFKTPGRYYVWVRAYSTGSEDNGLHVGLDGTWPESGQRLQWCEGKQSWRWDSKQRTAKVHCGERHKIYLDIDQPGLHTIEFSMREDGFEFDKWLMTKDRDFTRPDSSDPS